MKTVRFVGGPAHGDTCRVPEDYGLPVVVVLREDRPLWGFDYSGGHQPAWVAHRYPIREALYFLTGLGDEYRTEDGLPWE